VKSALGVSCLPVQEQADEQLEQLEQGDDEQPQQQD
jgi:hypothetical protein